MLFGYDSNHKIFATGYSINYVLVYDAHPIFNVWRCDISNGNSYCECFDKGVDPNVKRKQQNDHILSMLEIRKDSLAKKRKKEKVI